MELPSNLSFPPNSIVTFHYKYIDPKTKLPLEGSVLGPNSKVSFEDVLKENIRYHLHVRARGFSVCRGCGTQIQPHKPRIALRTQFTPFTGSILVKYSMT